MKKLIVLTAFLGLSAGVLCLGNPNGGNVVTHYGNNGQVRILSSATLHQCVMHLDRHELDTVEVTGGSSDNSADCN